MENSERFKELLEKLRDEAGRGGGRLSRQKIRDTFGEGTFTEEQMALIFAYFQNQGFEIETGEEPAEEAGSFDGLEAFLDRVRETHQPEAPVQLSLFHRAASGDADAVTRLAEAYLETVCDLAGEYEQEGINPEDLVQEAGMGLMMALGALEPQESLAAYQAVLINAVSSHLEEVVARETEYSRGGNALAGRVNRLSGAIRSLEEELGHTVSLEELSAYLELPAEQILEVMKLAGDALREDKN